MAVIARTVQTFTRTNIREDVANVIENVDPIETPFLSSLSKGEKPASTYFEWTQDTHEEGVGTNAKLEGADAEFEAAPPVSRLGNYTQISDKAIIISDTSRAVQNYGYEDEAAYQTMKKAVGLKKDMETRLLGHYGSNAGAESDYSNAVPSVTSGGAARQTAGVPSWITTHYNKGADITEGSEPAAGPGGFNSNTKLVEVRKPGQSRSLTEVMFVNQLAAVMENTTMIPKSIYVPIKLKSRISRVFKGVGDLQANYSAARGGAPSTLTAVSSIDFYRTDFGLVSIMWNRYMAKDIVLMLNMKKWKICYLIPYHIINIARTGRAIKKMLTVEFGLKCKHEKSNAILADITNEYSTT